MNWWIKKNERITPFGSITWRIYSFSIHLHFVLLSLLLSLFHKKNFTARWRKSRPPLESISDGKETPVAKRDRSFLDSARLWTLFSFLPNITYIYRELCLVLVTHFFKFKGGSISVAGCRWHHRQQFNRHLERFTNLKKLLEFRLGANCACWFWLDYDDRVITWRCWEIYTQSSWAKCSGSTSKNVNF